MVAFNLTQELINAFSCFVVKNSRVSATLIHTALKTPRGEVHLS